MVDRENNMDFDKVLDEAADAVAIKEADVDWEKLSKDPRILSAIGGGLAGGLGGYFTTEKDRDTKKRHKGKAAMRAIIGTLLGGGLGAGGASLIQAMRREASPESKFKELTGKSLPSEEELEGRKLFEQEGIAREIARSERHSAIENTPWLKDHPKLIDAMKRNDDRAHGFVSEEVQLPTFLEPIAGGIAERIPGLSPEAGRKLLYELWGGTELLGAKKDWVSPSSVASAAIHKTPGIGSIALAKGSPETWKGTEKLLAKSRRLGEGMAQAKDVAGFKGDAFNPIGVSATTPLYKGLERGGIFGFRRRRIDDAMRDKIIRNLDKKISKTEGKLWERNVSASRANKLEDALRALKLKKSQTRSWNDIQRAYYELADKDTKAFGKFKDRLSDQAREVAKRDAKAVTRGTKALLGAYLTRDLQRDFLYSPLANLAYGGKPYGSDISTLKTDDMKTTDPRGLGTDIMNMLLKPYNTLPARFRTKLENF